ncbi:MAG: CRP-like cAMP-binding protein [Bacteriovoracaceae bacterium]|jgi:CRP-like cAMP-binding protein
MSAIANLVKGCPLFHEIYDNEVEAVLADCLVASYSPGDIIIKQGEDGTDICVILSGKADITVDKDGHSQFIATIGNGDIFGEMVLINETKRTANIICKEKCAVLVMSFDNFYKVFSKNPSVFALMVLNVTRLITKRLKHSNSVIQELNAKLAKATEDKAA